MNEVIGKTIASVAIVLCTGVAVWITRNPNTLWTLLIVPIVWRGW